MTRCCAYENKKQCRCSKDLVNVLVDVHREKNFEAKLPKQVVVSLCAKHLRLSIYEQLVASSMAIG